ncbi:MAG TPA: hypothetical protein VMK12_32630, partial [Anaeromyxobacteraceae bacterium]|nr:hypothetical protein [Anaeromyxobacteraceae bacterium]
VSREARSVTRPMVRKSPSPFFGLGVWYPAKTPFGAQWPGAARGFQLRSDFAQNYEWNYHHVDLQGFDGGSRG